MRCRYNAAEPGASLEENAAEGILGTDAPGEKMPKIRMEPHSCMGMAWCAGWLFTIGFVHLTFWKGVLALVVWPYYLGAHFGAVAR